MNSYTKKLKANLNGNYFVFLGQKASTGTPNKRTGKYSFYGTYYRFNNKKEAIDFAEKSDTGYNQCVSVCGTVNTLRKYNLGSSVTNYYEHLNNLDYEVFVVN